MVKGLWRIVALVLLGLGLYGTAQAAKVAVVAHRGGAALAPENTLSAFRNAVKLGVDMVECDVHLSKDGEMVVMHDADLSRTTNGSGYIQDKTLAELKESNAAAKFADGTTVEQIPTLSEVLDLLKKSKVNIQIEIKNGPNGRYPGIEKKIIDLLKAKRMIKRAIIISFDFSAIKDVKIIDRHITTGALLDGWGNKTAEQIIEEVFEQTRANYFLPGYPSVTEELVKVAHSRGMKVGTWTVDGAPDMLRLAKLGVDAITTDCPDLLKTTLRK